MKSWQLVSRYNHMLHPFSCDHHQVSNTSADVVPAHRQSKSCREKTRKGKREQNLGQV